MGAEPLKISYIVYIKPSCNRLECLLKYQRTLFVWRCRQTGSALYGLCAFDARALKGGIAPAHLPYRCVCLRLGKGTVAWLLRHPQNLSFSKQQIKKLTPNEPLENLVWLNPRSLGYGTYSPLVSDVGTPDPLVQDAQDLVRRIRKSCNISNIIIGITITNK